MTPEEKGMNKLLIETQREIRGLKNHIKILEEDYYSPKEYEESLDRGNITKRKALKEQAELYKEDKLRLVAKMDSIASEIFEKFATEDRKLQCADTIITLKGATSPWTVEGVAVSNAYSMIIEKLKQKYVR